MNKAELKKYLEKGFRSIFLSDYRKKKYKYVKECNGFYYTFMFTSVNLDGWYPTTFSFGIGSSELKKILEIILPEQYIDIIENHYFPAIFYGQIRLFDENKYPIIEYDIKTEADAQRMVDEVSDYILNTILLEWESNPTLEYLEKKVNEKLLDVPNYSGLILSKMVNPLRYEEIKNHFMIISQDWAEWNRENLQKVINFLDNYTSEELNKLASEI